jgi:hypothetical protein
MRVDTDALDLVPLEELQRAVLRRGDVSLVVVFTRDGAGHDHMTWAMQGDRHKVVGLIEEIKHLLFKQAEAEQL